MKNTKYLCEVSEVSSNPESQSKASPSRSGFPPLTYYVQVSSARGCNIARQATPCQDQYELELMTGALVLYYCVGHSYPIPARRSLMPSTSALTSRPHYHPSLFRLSGTSSNSQLLLPFYSRPTSFPSCEDRIISHLSYIPQRLCGFTRGL